MTKAVTSVVIVGGGTAGWITAGTIAARLKADRPANSYSVTLIESPNMPTIGVGEGTWPTMRSTLLKMGVRETDFVRECFVSFKQGARFAKWCTGADDDFYYHPLVLPQGYSDINLAPHWQEQESDLSFSKAVCPQEYVCERGLAPKLISTPEYGHVTNYAYHLDAGAFADFLKKHCIENLAVQHISDDVVDVIAADNGDIAAVLTKETGQVEGDLFVDCTGFRSLLLGGHYKVPFRSCKHSLFIDTALAVQVPYVSEESPIASQTISTAQSSGWIWDIALQTRRGIGHVYSSSHTTEEAAAEELATYVSAANPDFKDFSYRKIDINPGHRSKFWEKNCVAVGLSAGFLEPLEASALLLIEISANMIAEQFPATRSSMDIVRKRFNETFLYRWDRIIDFLKLHYVLNKRDDHAFWIDNRDPESVPDSLAELLEFWKFQYPWHNDFDRAVEVFPAASYQYVLYGMNFSTEVGALGVSERSRKMAQDQFSTNRKTVKKMLASLPTNRELLQKINQYGMQRV